MIAILGGAFIAAVVGEIVIRQRVDVAKNKSYKDQYINKRHMIFEFLLIMMYLMILSTSTFTEKTLYAFLLLFMSVMFLIRAFLDFAFRKAENRHYITAMYVVICLAASVIVLAV